MDEARILHKELPVKASLLFRSASVLILLFAAGHTLGFRQSDPGWGTKAVLAGMQGTRFTVQGFQRTYWDFFVGFGLFVSVFLFSAAVLAWQLGDLSPAAFTQMRWTAWALTASFGFVVVLSFRYFFLAPIVFACAIFFCLLAATLQKSRS